MIDVTSGKVVLSDESELEFKEIQDELKAKINLLKNYGKRGIITSFVKLNINSFKDNDSIILALRKNQFKSYEIFTKIDDYHRWRDDVYNNLFEAEKELKKRYMVKSLGNIFLFISFILIAIILNKNDFFDFGELENIDKYFTLIILGIAGSIIHFTVGENETKDKSLKGKYGNEVFSKLLVSLILPIVLVVLLYNAGSEEIGFKLNVETLSFLIGYSSTLVSRLLSKLVGIAEKMIDLIGSDK